MKLSNKVSMAVIAVISFTLVFASMGFSDVIVLFDEDEAGEAGNGNFSGLFVSHDAGSTVTVTDNDAIAGDVSAFCTPSQSYNPSMSGWTYSIDDYPYITFAWRKEGGTGIMLQLAFNNNWAYRYYSGVNVTNWEGIQLEDDIPEEWIVYTRNLVDDFVGGWNLTGVALTPWDGEGGYYDHILIHSEEDEGEIGQLAVESDGKLATTWAGLKK